MIVDAVSDGVERWSRGGVDTLSMQGSSLSLNNEFGREQIM